MDALRRPLSLVVVVLIWCGYAAAQSGSFTDDPLVANVTPVRAVHVTELRARIDAARASAGLPVFTFSDPVLAARATVVRAQHISEMRAALLEVYQRLGAAAPAFTPVSTGTPIRAVHINELRAAVVAVAGPAPGEDLQLSPGVVTLAGVAEDAFNSTAAPLRFDLAGAQFAANADDVRVFLDGVVVDAALVQVAPGAVTVAAILENGRNEVDLLARDSGGRFIDFSATLWAGEAILQGVVVAEGGAPLAGASVTARLALDQRVRQAVTASASGEFTLINVPERTIVLDAASAGRYGSLTLKGTAGIVGIQAQAIGPPSPVSNNDFSMGTAGWDLGDAAGQVEIVPHDEGRSSEVVAAETDFDLKLTTGGIEGPRRISRTFAPSPGARHVKVRYRFVTSEVPGGFFGTEFDDAFTVSVRSEMGGGVISESASMNSLGLGAFDGEGATSWRETRLPVSPFGDVVRVDVSVANVADELFDSYVVVDAVSEPTLVLSDVELEDIDGSPLEFLSVAASHPYFGGKTRIYGSFGLDRGPEDTGVLITLDIVQNGAVVAFASYAGPVLGPGESEVDGLLFELGSEQAAQIDVGGDGTVFLVARAQSVGGNVSIFPVGKVTLLARFAGANRTLAPRNDDQGGDDWAQPGMVALAAHFANNQYDDFSNMNAGEFPPHTGHATGDEVDAWFHGYNARDAAAAATIIGYLNDPLYGSDIERVLVTFERSSANPFWNAIATVILADGRRASDVIQPAPGYTTRFHMERGTAEVGDDEISSAAARSRRTAARLAR